MNALDGRDSINVSLEEHKGMSLKDSDKTAIPSFVYKDLWNDAYLSVPGTCTFLVVADNTSDSLRLVDFSALVVEEINALLSSKTPNDDTIYFYRNGQGFAYTTIGTQILYGNYFSKEVPSSDDSMAFVDWRGYLDKINAAYISDANSFNVFSKHEGLAPRSYTLQRYANSFGFFQTNLRSGCTNSNYIIGFGKENTDFKGSSLPSSIKEYILNGLHVDTDTPLANIIDASCSGLGHVHISTAYRLGAIYGRIDAGDNNVSIYGLTTGSREVAFGSKITNGFVDIFNCSFQVSDDVELNDISHPVKELINKQDTTLQYLVDTRLKTIRKDRTGASATISSIYTTDKDFICGYNNMTGKCLCMALEEEVPEIVVPMPDYFNSAGIDITGLYTECPVSSNNQQNPLVGRTIPVFNYRARYRIKDASGVAHSTTKDGSKDTYVNSPYWGSRDEYVNDPGSPAGYNIWKFDESNLITQSNYPNYWGCFYVFSQDDTGYYPTSTTNPYSEGKGYDNNTTASLGGPNNDTLAFFKISSDTILDYPATNSNKCWHWHVYCKPNGYACSASYYRLELPGSPKYNVIYERVRDEQGNVTYREVSRDKDLVLDKWYSFVWYPVTTTTAKPIVVELDDDDMNHIQQGSVVNRYCVKRDDMFKFSINTPDGTKTFEIPETGDKPFSRYFSIRYESDGTTIKQVDLIDKTAMIADYGDACLYIPSSGNVCNIIDKDLKNKRIFTQVCIPEFSGCTFVSC
jgi:hypothetical protein